MRKSKSKIMMIVEEFQKECERITCTKCELEKFCDSYVAVGPYKWVEVIERMKVKND